MREKVKEKRKEKNLSNSFIVCCSKLLLSSDLLLENNRIACSARRLRGRSLWWRTRSRFPGADSRSELIEEGFDAKRSHSCMHYKDWPGKMTASWRQVSLKRASPVFL